MRFLPRDRLEMDVKTVCLGMLTDGEASGYDLKKEFESTFAHFYGAGYGSIYPALSSLAADGLVDCREIPQEGKPDRKVYRINAAGRRRLAEVLENPGTSHKIRSEFLAALFFAHLMDPAQIEKLLEDRIREIEKYLALFREYLACDEDWYEGQRFVCGFGKATIEAQKKYIEENAHMLRETPAQKKTATG